MLHGSTDHVWLCVGGRRGRETQKGRRVVHWRMPVTNIEVELPSSSIQVSVQVRSAMQTMSH